MRVPFNNLFCHSEEGITPRVPLQIGVFELTPNTDDIGSRHVDLNRFDGMDVEVVDDRVIGRQVIRGFYGELMAHVPPVEYPGKLHPSAPNKTGRFLSLVATKITSLIF